MVEFLSNVGWYISSEDPKYKGVFEDFTSKV
jgi:hypothetical protein